LAQVTSRSTDIKNMADVGLRGFCHLCDCEIAALAVGDDAFQCPYCDEQAVECPYTSYEHWQGTWVLDFHDGATTNQLQIDEAGLAVLSVAGQRGQCKELIWAPHSEEYLMRLEHHHPELDGVVDSLGFEPGPSLGGQLGLLVHRQFEDGSSQLGRATRRSRRQRRLRPAEQRGVFGRLFGDLMSTFTGAGREPPAEEDASEPPSADEPEREGLPMTDDARRFRQATQESLDRWVEQMAVAGPAARFSDAERARMQQQMRQAMRPFVDLMTSDPALMQILREQGQLVQPIPIPVVPPNPEFQHVFAHLFFDDDDFNRTQRQGTQSAVPERIVAKWLDERAAAETPEVDGDWVCPICFDSSMEDVIVICKADDKAQHSFHRDCIQGWLVRRNECPTCRRTPLIQPGAAGGASAAGR